MDGRFFFGGRTSASSVQAPAGRCYFTSVTKVLCTFSFFRKKKQKIASVETLAEFFGEKSSENQAVLALEKTTRTLWFSFAQRASADFSPKNSPGIIISIRSNIVGRAAKASNAAPFLVMGDFFFNAVRESLV